MSWATLLSLTVFSKSLSSWSCGLRKLGSYRPYRGTQTVGCCVRNVLTMESIHLFVHCDRQQRFGSSQWLQSFLIVSRATLNSFTVVRNSLSSWSCGLRKLQIRSCLDLVTLCWVLRFEYLNGISTKSRPEKFVTKMLEYRFWLFMTVFRVMAPDLSHCREITMRNKKAVASISDGILKKSQGMTPKTVQGNQNLHFKILVAQLYCLKCRVSGTPAAIDSHAEMPKWPVKTEDREHGMFTKI